MKKILLVFGTRPEAIKMAPLVKAFKTHSNEFETRVCVTGQHRLMLNQVLDFFDIEPDYNLDLMKSNQSLNSITADILIGMKSILDEYKPDFTLVHGDTATSTAAALASFFSEIKVAHIEAGLRTHNKWSPFPEEMNRQITSRLSDVHFSPTKQSRRNLIKEGITSDKIIITGNTVIDALKESVMKVNSNLYSNEEIDILQKLLDPFKSLILVTGHRRESFGNGFINICNALAELSDLRPNIQIVYPVHLNPNVQMPVYEILKNKKNIHLIDPLSYPSFVWIMNKAKLIITDSGGVQEEAPSLGKPILVLRDNTERPEAVKAGTVLLVGTNKKKIIYETLNLLDNESIYNSMSRKKNPYGDGNACKRIVEYFLSV